MRDKELNKIALNLKLALGIKPSIRLVKAAKELNIGTTKIAEAINVCFPNFENKPTSSIYAHHIDTLLNRYKVFYYNRGLKLKCFNTLAEAVDFKMSKGDDFIALRLALKL